MFINHIRHVLKFFPAVIWILTGTYAYGLTLEQAISFAEKNLPSYKAKILQVNSRKNLYKASLSPYIPSLDVSGINENINTSSENYDIYSYNTSLSYTLFDGGKRKSEKDISRLNFNSSMEDRRDFLINLQYNVKVLFFTAMSQKEILKQRKMQLNDAAKNYEIAKTRYQVGKALRSDMLKASVSLSQSKFDLKKAEGESAKSMYDLNSFTGRPLDTVYDLEYSAGAKPFMPEKNILERMAMEKPVAVKAENDVKISENNIFIDKSAYYPNLSFNLNHAGSETFNESGDKSSENRSVALTANWNLFKWDKHYKKKSSTFETSAQKMQLSEIKRLLILEINKRYEDYKTSIESLALAKQQLIEAQFSYDQALGEYMAGKGDILSLITSATLLSDARILASRSRLDFALSKAALELAAGIEKIENMKKVTVP